jgi:uncharacterized protein (UPF0305 family)
MRFIYSFIFSIKKLKKDMSIYKFSIIFKYLMKKKPLGPKITKMPSIFKITKMPPAVKITKMPSVAIRTCF